MFLELDKPFLQSLPNERYIYKEFKEVTVSKHILQSIFLFSSIFILILELILFKNKLKIYEI
mgnify:CR=1 FL=1